MVSTGTSASLEGSCSIPKNGSNESSKSDNDLRRADYEHILKELCRKVDGPSYYSGSSSTWFLKGALAKYEDESGKETTYSPKGLTDVLLEKLLLRKDGDNSCDDPLARKQQQQQQQCGDTYNDRETEEKLECECECEPKTEDIHQHDETDPDYEKYLSVAKALARDVLKYLPAIVASLSDLVSPGETSAPSKALPSISPSWSSSWSSSSAESTETPSIVADEDQKPITIPKEFLKLWVATIVDDATPQNLHDQLSDNLFLIFRQAPPLRDRDANCDAPSFEDTSSVHVYALSCLVKGDTWNGNRHCESDGNANTKSLSPPTTATTLRRAVFLVRFLSRDLRCKTLETSTKLEIATASGAIEWFADVLRGENIPIRYQKQNRETRAELLDLLLEEYKTASLGWLFLSSSLQLEEAVVKFFQNSIRELVEDWKEHLDSSLPTPSQLPEVAKAVQQQQQRQQPQQHRQANHNRDLLPTEHQKARCCATRFVRFLARLPPKRAFLSTTTEGNGRSLLAQMFHRQEAFSLQRLRLVRLLIDEFGADSNAKSCNAACPPSSTTETNGDSDSASIVIDRREWLSSPEIMGPVLEECSNDPFLGSSDATDRYLCVYGDPSWKGGFSTKKKLPEAPPPRAIQPQASGSFVDETAPIGSSSRLSFWLSETKGKMSVAGRSILGTLRHKDRNQQGDDHYSLFDGG